MSDRIKKIKIKQTDGTFSDYIPIGANAKDIDLQYNDSNVENTLKKKPYYYDNVATMKLDDTLREGDMAITLGYYEANDGGGAEYIIKSNGSDEVIDNCFIYELDNQLLAKMIIKNNTINFKSLGAKSQSKDNILYDNKNYIDKYLDYIENISEKTTLYIPSGIYAFSPTDLESTHQFTIKGQFSYPAWRYSGTIIVPYQDNQEYIWYIGGKDNIISYGNMIEDIVFSSAYFVFSSSTNTYALKTSDNEGHVYSSSVKNILNAALIIKFNSYSNYNNINFRYIKGCALDISQSWELYFNWINFRMVSSPSKGCLNFNSVDDIHSNSNLTALNFEYLMFEAIHGHCINISTNAKLANSHFGTINVEPGNNEINDGIHTIINDVDEVDTLDIQHWCVINMESNAQGDFEVNNIELNNFPVAYDTINNINYMYDVVLSGKYDKYASPIINNISRIGGKIDLNIFYFDDTSCSNQQSITINNFSDPNNDTKPKFNVKGYKNNIITNIRPKRLYKNWATNECYISNGVLIPLYKAAINLDTPHGPLYYDEKAINTLSLAVQLFNTVDTPVEDRMIIWFPLDKSKFAIRYRIENGKIGNLGAYLYKDGVRVNTKYTGDLNGDDQYHWFEFDFSDILTEYAHDWQISLFQQDNKNGDVYLDCYKTY